tara:strand:- start:50 stop:451 length:402 start_codon:yes stop_codon:yes gene_type:complete
MILYTKQFSNAVRQVIKKHRAKVHTRYTFGTSGNCSMFTSEGKRKISFNCIGTKKQFNLIRKDLVKLFAGTWQQNFMKYKWNTDGWHDKRMFRIEGTCLFEDKTKEEFAKIMETRTHNILWGKLAGDTTACGN